MIAHWPSILAGVSARPAVAGTLSSSLVRVDQATILLAPELSGCQSTPCMSLDLGSRDHRSAC